MVHIARKAFSLSILLGCAHTPAMNFDRMKLYFAYSKSAAQLYVVYVCCQRNAIEQNEKIGGETGMVRETITSVGADAHLMVYGLFFLLCL